MKAAILRRKGLGFGSCKSICESSETGIKTVRNDKMTDQDFEGVDLVIRWGCTSTVPVKKVLNKAGGIHTVSDKLGFRYILQKYAEENSHLIAPVTVFDGIEVLRWFNIYDRPLVVRPAQHAQGKNIWVVDNYEEFCAARAKIDGNWYASEYIKKVKEFRVFVCQNRVVWVANKIPVDPDAIVWNLHSGGSFENVRWGSWNLDVCTVALKAMQLSGLDFGGVDVILDEDGEAYVLEINSAPTHKSPYRESCTAKVFDYICNEGKDHFGKSEYDPNNWRHYIHPAIWSKK